MPAKEATARIKINKLLEAAGWLFFPEGPPPVNIQLQGARLKLRPQWLCHCLTELLGQAAERLVRLNRMWNEIEPAAEREKQATFYTAEMTRLRAPVKSQPN